MLFESKFRRRDSTDQEEKKTAQTKIVALLDLWKDVGDIQKELLETAKLILNSDSGLIQYY